MMCPICGFVNMPNPCTKNSGRLSRQYNAMLWSASSPVFFVGPNWSVNNALVRERNYSVGQHVLWPKALLQSGMRRKTRAVSAA